MLLAEYYSVFAYMIFVPLSYYNFEGFLKINENFQICLANGDDITPNSQHYHQCEFIIIPIGYMFLGLVNFLLLVMTHIFISNFFYETNIVSSSNEIVESS